MVRITDVVKNLIIINVLLFVVVSYNMIPIVENLRHYFTLYSIDTGEFKPYQLFTSMFMHSGSARTMQPVENMYDTGYISWSHLLFNMLSLFFLGPMVESVLGTKRFLFLYISAGLMGGLAAALLTSNTASMGASAAINGVAIAFALMFPNVKLMVFPIPFEIKAIYLIGAYIAYDLFAGIASLQTGIGHFAHLGGAIMGGLLIYKWGLSSIR